VERPSTKNIEVKRESQIIRITSC